MAPKTKIVKKKFWDDATELKHQQDAHHPLLKSYGYDFHSLESEGFRDMVRLLKYQDMIFFCSKEFFVDNQGTDPECVRLFYANLRSKENVFESIVYGKEIVFNLSDLQIFLASLSPINNVGTSIDGITIEQLKEKSFIDQIDIPSLLDPSYRYLTKPTTSHLTRDNRLMVHILFHAILPHNGSMTSLSPFHLTILHCFNKKIKVNLASLIAHHMLHVLHLSKQHYPFGNFISLFMNKKFNIPLSPKRDHTFQLYNEKNLINIFTRDESSRSWTFSPKSNSNKRARVSEDEPVTPSQSSIKSPSTSQSEPSMDEHFGKFCDMLSKKVLDKIDERMDQMEKTINDKYEMLDDRVLGCELRMKDHIETIHGQMDKVGTMFQSFGNVLKHVNDTVKESSSKRTHYNYF